jgi:hypothetical protein
MDLVRQVGHRFGSGPLSKPAPPQHEVRPGGLSVIFKGLGRR